MTPPDPIRIQLVKPTKTSEDFWTAFLIGLVGAFLDGAFLMLGFAAAHEIWDGIPPAGYVTCFMLNLGLIVVGGYLRVGQRERTP